MKLLVFCLFAHAFAGVNTCHAESRVTNFAGYTLIQGKEEVEPYLHDMNDQQPVIKNYVIRNGVYLTPRNTCAKVNTAVSVRRIILPQGGYKETPSLAFSVEEVDCPEISIAKNLTPLDAKSLSDLDSAKDS